LQKWLFPSNTLNIQIHLILVIWNYFSIELSISLAWGMKVICDWIYSNFSFFPPKNCMFLLHFHLVRRTSLCMFMKRSIILHKDIDMQKTCFWCPERAQYVSGTWWWQHQYQYINKLYFCLHCCLWQDNFQTFKSFSKHTF
jgi:hypothetical protein